MTPERPLEARRVHIVGVVQGVGFRPFVYRLAHEIGLTGWVLNGDAGVEVHVEGDPSALGRFVDRLRGTPPPAARIDGFETEHSRVEGHRAFVIRASRLDGAPSVRISPDLSMCADCRQELFDPANRRFHYPYINCTNCGPRYSIIEALPYDRRHTTMAGWELCEACRAEYLDPNDRRFHAQPVACADCGPQLELVWGEAVTESGVDAPPPWTGEPFDGAASLLQNGGILAIKGLGGYHLACDARNPAAVQSLRTRKYRKEKPFALMARDQDCARELVEFSPAAAALLTSTARPIVLAPARQELSGVAPGNEDLGIMLPYTPIHELLFAAGAPEVIVLTSGNRSSEPIAYRDEDARERLSGLADAFLIGERPIARRADDSVVRPHGRGSVMVRRARGYAPSSVTRLPGGPPLLAVGADLKNSVTLVVDGDAFQSQHVGDLVHVQAYGSFRETVADLLAMYGLEAGETDVAHDFHPEFASTQFALEGGFRSTHAVQHHRAHVASVLAERGAWETRVVGVAFDGTGYGDDGTIWGGEVFAGSLERGLERVAHLHPAPLPGGDAAARHPVQSAAGFMSVLDGQISDRILRSLSFPARYGEARQLIARDLRVFQTTSAGRLFDAFAAICGFHSPMTFEGQAAVWLEQMARKRTSARPYPVPSSDGVLDWRPAIRGALADRARGRDPADISASFHSGLARGLVDLVIEVCQDHGVHTVALSGGVFQNVLLLEHVSRWLTESGLEVWTNRRVPPNDGGISLGQAAMVRVGHA